jgi:hypothetical protein
VPASVRPECSCCTPALGAFVLRNGKVRWHPAVDVTTVITTRRPWWARLLSVKALNASAG